MTQLADTPIPPYYAVIFSSKTSGNVEGYAEMSRRILELAADQPGFLGVESAREDLGITVSYWRDEESIKSWKEQVQHLHAQKLGRDRWYSAYTTRVARVEREYSYSSQ